jgi:NAD(P)-dependent dehydrogenase (short-subunit alcohol dehydrogenase family)
MSTTPDLSGKTVVVTGATGGIGLVAAVVFARAGARVAIVGRDAARAEAALAAIRQRSGSTTVEARLCDFSSQAAVRRLAAGLADDHARIDVLVNNAGSVHRRRTLTEDGIEATFAVNHLGPFLLTNLLLDRLLAGAPARIVNVASTQHYEGTLDFDDLGFERGYGILRAYARSKLANVLFTRELARRLAGAGVTVNALHPGKVATGIWSHGAPPWARAPFAAVFAAARPFMLTPERGAQTIVHLATAPEVAGMTGLYFEKNRPKPPSVLARDDALARRLWDASARLVRLESA